MLRKFDANCLPRTNETYEAYKFFSRSKNAGETVEAYITALYKLSSTCNFGTMTDRLIKDRLVIGIRDDKVREKLLAKEQLDLETYGAPFSHLFTELKISPIELKISTIQLKISPIKLKISPNQLEISTNRPI